MIISNSQQYIFIHITKSAGTSITMALENKLQWNDLALGGSEFGESIQDAYRKRFGLHKHSFASEVKQVVGQEIWDSYYKFSFVRHPYPRAVSLYTFIEYAIQKKGFRRYLPKSLRRWPFWHWPATVAYLETRNFSEFIRHEGLLENDRGIRPQADWLTDSSGNLIVDFVGRVENIQQDFGTIAQRLGIECGTLERHNTSQKATWTSHLKDEKDFQYLYDLYEKDFSMFDYDPDIRG